MQGHHKIARSMGHVPALDGVRAAAIGVVMVAHAGLEGVVPGGFGVTLFFFLSGYLITSLLRLEAAASGGIDLKSFYLRRTVRILPPMILTVMVANLLGLAGLTGVQPTANGFVVDLFFLTNYAPQLGVEGGGAPIPLWSLDVEEHFYIAFSTLFALVLAGLRPSRAALICGALCAVILGARIGHWLADTPLWTIYYWSHTRLDSILFGCVLALWHNPAIDRAAWKPGKAAIGAALLLLLLTFALRDEVFRQTVRYSLQGVAIFILFSAALQSTGTVRGLLSSYPLRFIALLSYTLYLIHVPMLKVAAQLELPMPYAFAYAFSFAYAYAMYRLVEQPLARWRHGVEQRQRAQRPGLVGSRLETSEP